MTIAAKDISKKLNKYIFSSMLAMIGVSCYFLVDTFFISVASGANGITSLNLCLPMYAVICALGSMIGIGAATNYNLDRSMGKEDYQLHFSNAILWVAFFSSIFLFMGIAIPEKVLLLMGADDVILHAGLPYMRTMLCFGPAFMMNLTVTPFVRNDNAPSIAMAATLCSSFFNIIFDYILMFPLGLGLFGAALASGISPLVSIAVCMIHFFSKKNTLRFLWKLPSIRRLLRACSLGVAGFVGEISSGVITMCFNLVLLRIAGNIGVAAYGIIANISLVGISLFNGISQGLQPMASEAGGLGRTEEHKFICRHSLVIGIIFSAVFVAILWGFTAPIVNIFNSEGSAALSDYATVGLRLYSLGFLLAVVNIVRSGYFGAIGRARECSVISLLRGIVAIVVFVIILPLFLDIYGVWLAFPVSELFTFFVSVIYAHIPQKNDIKISE